MLSSISSLVNICLVVQYAYVDHTQGLDQLGSSRNLTGSSAPVKFFSNNTVTISLENITMQYNNLMVHPKTEFRLSSYMLVKGNQHLLQSSVKPIQIIIPLLLKLTHAYNNFSIKKPVSSQCVRASSVSSAALRLDESIHVVNNRSTSAFVNKPKSTV